MGDEVDPVANDGPIDLENQFILRLPPVPATALRAAVNSGVNLKDRFTIQIEQDQILRHAKVRFDGWSLPAKIVDLPTIIESQKTLDNKTFYKTADICQMMICKEEIDDDRNDDKGDESKKKDGKDKKFQWPHGITPPLKNVRKKRFRKTLKKKFVDVPEIEKEVRRLFKTDGDAVHVRFEVVNADEDKGDGKPSTSGYSGGNANVTNNNSHSMDIVEHDLFGDVVSSSDEEDTRAKESDDGSRLSASAKFASSTNTSEATGQQKEKLMTEFPRGMLVSHAEQEQEAPMASYDIATESASAASAVAALEEATSSNQNEALLSRLSDLREEIANLQNRRQQQEEEIAGIENMALKQRFRSLINSLIEQETEKRRQYDEILNMLNSS